jgi:hypothetical protein
MKLRKRLTSRQEFGTAASPDRIQLALIHFKCVSVKRSRTAPLPGRVECLSSFLGHSGKIVSMSHALMQCRVLRRHETVKDRLI